MKFIAMVWAAFLARVSPASAMANPACMNMTRKPQKGIQTKLIATRLCPTTSASLTASGSLAAMFFMSSAEGAPGVAPTTSLAEPTIV